MGKKGIVSFAEIERLRTVEDIDCYSKMSNIKARFGERTSLSSRNSFHGLDGFNYIHRLAEFFTTLNFQGNVRDTCYRRMSRIPTFSSLSTLNHHENTYKNLEFNN